MYTKNRSRMGTYVAQSPIDLQKNRSEYHKSDKAPNLMHKTSFDENEESNYLANRLGNNNNARGAAADSQQKTTTKKESTGYGSQGGQFDEQMLKFVNKKPKERSVTFNLPSNPENQRINNLDQEEKSALGVILTEDDREDENHMSKAKSPRERAATFDRQ